MRLAILAALLVALAAPAAAQGTPAPPSAPAPCVPRDAGLAGIGRASVVAFRGVIYGGNVCATVANLALGSFGAQVGGVPPAGALAVAALGNAATLSVTPSGDLTTGGPGPYLIAPGGTLGDVGSADELPRVAVAFAGQRVLLISTSAVTLADLARALRDQPDLFGVESVERAVVVASGPDATLALRTDDGTWGTPPAPGRPALALAKR